MMRSLFSGVAGLKTHQTKMDVIGNNISNVNTTAYKSQSITFNELMYQTTKRASGSNGITGGTNANQIGLGVKVGAINTAITSQGATQTTNMPFDLNITGSNFFIVNNGMETFFTRAGSFYVDGMGNLAMTSTGYNVMGWQVSEETGEPEQAAVSPLKIMTEENMKYPPAATTLATVGGIADKFDSDINSSRGKAMNLEFYDNLGFKYTAKFSVHLSDGDAGQYYVKLDDITDSTGESIGAAKMANVSFGQASQTVSTNSASLRKTGTNMVQAMGISSTATGVTTAFTVNVGQQYDITGTATAPTLPATITGTAVSVANIEALYEGATGKIVAGSKISFDKDGNMTVTDSNGGTNVFRKLATTSEDIQTVSINDGATPVVYSLSSAGGATYAVTPGSPPVPVLTVTPAANAATPTAVEVNAAIEALYGISLEGVRSFTIADDGTLTITQKDVTDAALLEYIPGTGAFARANNATNGQVTLDFNNTADGMTNFTDIMIDFSTTTMANKDTNSTLAIATGGTGENVGLGMGRKPGDMLGVVVDDSGRIYANYSNGQSRLLGQIATAAFANASGLEKRGDNLYSATQNSGEFNGMGVDIKTGGGYMTSGVLEMSNVDLSAEFTDMITTQRGFQANSRIITVSDTLLEELTNLKR